MSVSQHLLMAGLMTSSVLSGLRNPSFPRLQHGTHPESLFFSFSMAMALTKHHTSFSLLTFITLSFSAFHLIPPTNCNLLMSAYLVHCNEHGRIDVIALLHFLPVVPRCIKRISSMSTCKLGNHRLNPAPSSQHSGRAEFGQLIGQSSLVMIMHPASHFQLRLEVFLCLPHSQTIQILARIQIQIQIRIPTPTLNHIQLPLATVQVPASPLILAHLKYHNLCNSLHNHLPNLHHRHRLGHHPHQQLAIPLPRLPLLVPAFPGPFQLSPLYFTMTWFFLTVSINSNCKCSNFQGMSN